MSALILPFPPSSRSKYTVSFAGSIQRAGCVSFFSVAEPTRQMRFFSTVCVLDRILL